MSKHSRTYSIDDDLYLKFCNLHKTEKISHVVVRLIKSDVDNINDIKLPEFSQVFEWIRKEDPQFMAWLKRANNMVEERKFG